MLTPAPRRLLPPDWNVAGAAVVVCDMWDTHHCVTAARRVAEMAPRMNEVLGGLRARGALVVHAPHGCMDFYAGTSARLRAVNAPFVPVPHAIGWHTWEPAELAALPANLTAPGWCACRAAEPCGDAAAPWTRQTALIDIAPEDVVTDDGQEFYNVLEERGIADVLLVGVHTNVCVLSRPYGICQLVYWGKRPVLCRDLTDAFHRDPRGYAWGTEEVVAHIARRWCPVVTSDQLVGGEPFRFADDDRDAPPFAHTPSSPPRTRTSPIPPWRRASRPASPPCAPDCAEPARPAVSRRCRMGMIGARKSMWAHWSPSGTSARART